MLFPPIYVLLLSYRKISGKTKVSISHLIRLTFQMEHEKMGKTILMESKGWGRWT